MLRVVIVLFILFTFTWFMGCTEPSTFIMKKTDANVFIDANLVGKDGQIPFMDNNKLSLSNKLTWRKDINKLSVNSDKFYVDMNGAVSIGGTNIYGVSSNTRFLIQRDWENVGMTVEVDSTANAYPFFTVARARGTEASRLPVTTNDVLGGWFASAYDGNAFQTGGVMQFTADGTPVASGVPTKFGIFTGTNRWDRAERITVRSDGNIGMGTTTPKAFLHVNAKAVVNQGETIARFTVSDVATNYVEINNGSTINTAFLPTFKGMNMVDGRAALAFSGWGMDVAYSSNLYPLVSFYGRKYDDSPLTTSPVVGFMNYTEAVLMTWYDARTKIGGTDTINMAGEGATRPTTMLDVIGEGTSDLLKLVDGTTTRFYVDDDGVTSVANDINQYGGETFVNLIYGEINAMDITVPIPSANTYFPIPDANTGLVNGFTYTDTNLTATYNGVYQITSQWSFSGGVTNEYHLSLRKNSTPETKCHSERVLGSGGDVGSASYTCLVRLAIGDIITPIIENATAGNNAVLHDFQLVAVRVGN